MPLSTRPPSPHVGRVWVLWLVKWPGEGCQGCRPAQSPPGGGAAGSCPHLPKPPLLLRVSAPHRDTATDHSSILPCLPGCHMAGRCFSRRQSRGSLPAALPALPAQLGSVLSVHPTKPSEEAGWPSEKLLQEHLSPGSSQGIPHLPSSLLKFPDVVLHTLQGSGKIKFSLHLQPPSCHVCAA